VTTPGDDSAERERLAQRLDRLLSLPADEADEVVVTLAELGDRRVIPPLIDLLVSGRATELVVRAAGWLADPALHPALERLAASRIGDLGEPEYWHQVDRATARCRPEAAAEAEDVEVALLVAAQAALVQAGAVLVEVGLDGSYPTTEVVVDFGDHQRRHSIWNFDEANPDDPGTLDHGFARYRIAQLATWG
jgi:hypothetical protein